jgi:hypothetical protein
MATPGRAGDVPGLLSVIYRQPWESSTGPRARFVTEHTEGWAVCLQPFWLPTQNLLEMDDRKETSLLV